jgi:hypothetical protein
MFLVKPSDDSGFLNTNSMSAVGDLQCKSLMSKKGFSRTNKFHVHGLIKTYLTKGQKKQSNTWCCSHNPLQSSPLQTPHTCSSGPFIVRSILGTGSLEQPTAASLLFLLAPTCLENYFPSTAFSPPGIENSHMWPCLVNREDAAPVGSDV